MMCMAAVGMATIAWAEEKAPAAAPAAPAPAAAPAPPAAPNLDKVLDDLSKLDPNVLLGKMNELTAETGKLAGEAKALRDKAAQIDEQIAQVQKRIAVLEKLMAAFKATTQPAAKAAAATDEPKAMAQMPAPAAAPEKAMQAAAPKEVILNYKDNIFPIFEEKCLGCHNPDKARGGLAIDSYSAMMEGGSSGQVVSPGDPDGSRLFRLVSHMEKPEMPPRQSKLPDDKLAIIKLWITQGAAKDANTGPLAKKESTVQKSMKKKLALGKPDGPPPMPTGLEHTTSLAKTPRPTAVTAMDSSPTAPLLAVSGHEQILLFNVHEKNLLGVLPFPEGQVQCIKFSDDGTMLVTGGGQSGKKGVAIVWDVVTGKRLGEFGREYDIVLAADISPDGAFVALGGPSRKVRVYSTESQELAYEITAHADWIYAIEFNAYADLIATADRSGGLFVWEADTGREVHVLKGHTAAVTDLSFHGETDILASTSEDRTVQLWEMEEGKQVKKWTAHDAASFSVEFHADGRLVTSGADRRTRVWKQDGGQIRSIDNLPDWVYQASFSDDGKEVIAGTWDGMVGVWEAESGKELAKLTTNP